MIEKKTKNKNIKRKYIGKKKVDVQGNRINLNPHPEKSIKNIKFIHTSTLEFLVYMAYSHFDNIEKLKYINGFEYFYFFNDGSVLCLEHLITEDDLPDLISDLNMLNLKDCLYIIGTIQKNNTMYQREYDLTEIYKNDYRQYFTNEQILKSYFIEINQIKIFKVLQKYLNLFEDKNLLPDKRNYVPYYKLQQMCVELLDEIYNSASTIKLLNLKLFEELKKSDNLKYQYDDIRFIEFVLLLFKHAYIKLIDVNVINYNNIPKQYITLQITFNISPIEISKFSNKPLEYGNFRINESKGEMCYKEHVFNLKVSSEAFKFICYIIKNYERGISCKQAYIYCNGITEKKYNKTVAHENKDIEYIKNRFKELRKLFKQANTKFPIGISHEKIILK